MAKKKIVDYLSKFDSTHVIIAGLLLLYVDVFGLAADYKFISIFGQSAY